MESEKIKRRDFLRVTGAGAVAGGAFYLKNRQTIQSLGPIFEYAGKKLIDAVDRLERKKDTFNEISREIAQNPSRENVRNAKTWLAFNAAQAWAAMENLPITYSAIGRFLEASGEPLKINSEIARSLRTQGLDQVDKNSEAEQLITTYAQKILERDPNLRNSLPARKTGDNIEIITIFNGAEVNRDFEHALGNAALKVSGELISENGIYKIARPTIVTYDEYDFTQGERSAPDKDKPIMSIPVNVLPKFLTSIGMQKPKEILHEFFGEATTRRLPDPGGLFTITFEDAYLLGKSEHARPFTVWSKIKSGYPIVLPL